MVEPMYISTYLRAFVFPVTTLPIAVGVSLITACAPAKPASNTTPANTCVTSSLSLVSGSTGNGNVFNPDPMVASKNPSLSPISPTLDSYASVMPLSHLSGYGVLVGDYVDVRNGLACNEQYGTYDAKNQFVYQHEDSRFQETMAYYFGDMYRAQLDQAKVLAPSHAVEVVAHCENEDNAFFERGFTDANVFYEKVCLGDSVVTPGASYADDGIVTIHELQHATTVDTYTTDQTQSLNQLFYDEAGSMNEAISDFMALMYEEPLIPATFDSRVFSRWALGTFLKTTNATRGAQKCPQYDSAYPTCTNFPSFNSATNTISYVYPDGVGWPYGNNYSGPAYVKAAYQQFDAWEEIHNGGIVLVGALWDVYQAIKANHNGDPTIAQPIMMSLLMNAVAALPKRTTAQISPVTFLGLANNIVNEAVEQNFSDDDYNAIVAALTDRGLYNEPTITQSNWLDVGPGTGATPGMAVLDNPVILISWLMEIDSQIDTSPITQSNSTGLNNQLDPGETDAIWFDLQNDASLTAGGIQVTVTSEDPNVTFPSSLNIGAMNQNAKSANYVVQMMYQKVNGTAIVSSLMQGSSLFQLGTANTYFKTDPKYNMNSRNAIWATVSSNASHGEVAKFRVDALPANGVVSTREFSALIN